jgi:hypothetical protein
MKDINQHHAELISKALSSSAQPILLTSEEFEAIAKFVAVADELRHEPFLSEDNRDTIIHFPDSGQRIVKFGHPAFLKSAILPFRKLWMKNEPCNFEAIRDIIFHHFANLQLDQWLYLKSFKPHYYEFHESQLNQSLPAALTTNKVTNVRDLIDIWLYTHAVHTGKSARVGRFTLNDFDDVDKQAGRAIFEYEFRTRFALHAFNSYLNFHKIILEPIYQWLLTKGYVPSFETEAALKFNPYRYEFDSYPDDPFWHLDKESEEETFDRLKKRQSFGSLDSFFAGYFFSKRKALEALKKYESLEKLISDTKGRILESTPTDHKLQSHFHTRGLDLFARMIEIKVYERKIVCSSEEGMASLSHTYLTFKKEFEGHRAKVPTRYDSWKHDNQWS